MGIERSYKVFFGFEISASGSFWNSRGSVSFMKEQHSCTGDHVSDDLDAPENQIPAYNNQDKKQQVGNSDPSDHTIQDAVFEMVSEKDEVKENKNTDLQKAHKEYEQVTISRKIETYMHGREYANKGNLFDFSV